MIIMTKIKVKLSKIFKPRSINCIYDKFNMNINIIEYIIYMYMISIGGM